MVLRTRHKQISYWQRNVSCKYRNRGKACRCILVDESRRYTNEGRKASWLKSTQLVSSQRGRWREREKSGGGEAFPLFLYLQDTFFCQYSLTGENYLTPNFVLYVTFNLSVLYWAASMYAYSMHVNSCLCMLCYFLYTFVHLRKSSLWSDACMPSVWGVWWGSGARSNSLVCSTSLHDMVMSTVACSLHLLLIASPSAHQRRRYCMYICMCNWHVYTVYVHVCVDVFFT